MLLLRTCLFNRKQVGVDVTGPLHSRVRCRQASPPPGPIRTTCVDFPIDYVRIACRDLEGRGCTSSTVLTHYQDDFDGSTLKWLPIISTILPTTNINGIISRELFTGGPMISAGVARRLRFEHRFSNLLPLQQKLGCTHTKLDSRTSTSAGCLRISVLRPESIRFKKYTDDPAIDNQAAFTFAAGAVRHKLLSGLDRQMTKNETQHEVL